MYTSNYELLVNKLNKLNKDKYIIFNLIDELKDIPNSISTALNSSKSIQDTVVRAAGVSVTSKTPIVIGEAAKLIGDTYGTIRQYIGYSNTNVKIIGVSPGLDSAKEGAMSQVFEDISIMTNLPNFSVYSPSDSIECGLVFDQILKEEGPSYLSLTKFKTKDFNKKYFIKGKLNKLVEGEDAVVFVTGDLTVNTMIASEMLRENTKYSVSVVSVPTLKPIDEKDVIKHVLPYDSIITIEDRFIYGGLGDIISRIVAEKYLKRIRRIGIYDEYGRSGTRDDLYEYFSFTEEALYQQIKKYITYNYEEK